MEKRTIKKSFRFTPNEWNQIEIKCEKVGLTPSQYFQKIATTGRVAKQDCLKEKQVYLSQIAIVSNGINIISRNLNSGNRFDSFVLQVLLKIEQKLNDEWLP
ncbi:plasmid mobilization protein [Sulfurovum sp. CS9]|uniref:plasmid mobilization protein n=1 Tax=Sulfurovum sp. CS9 TaxID=3391146 RepID=UPI0039EAE074